MEIETDNGGDLLDLPDENYFKLKVADEDDCNFEMIESDTPTIQSLSGSVVWDKIYDVISKASLIPEFAESARGISNLLLQGSLDRVTKENSLMLIGGIISMNPALGWWCILNGGATFAQLVYILVELGFMNPSKTIMIYAIYKKSSSICQLYKCIA